MYIVKPQSKIKNSINQYTSQILKIVSMSNENGSAIDHLRFVCLKILQICTRIHPGVIRRDATTEYKCIGHKDTHCITAIVSHYMYSSQSWELTH